MSATTGEQTELVYGVTRSGDDVEATFIPRPRAETLARLFDAMYRARTWGDLRRLLTPELYTLVVEHQRYMADDDDLTMPSDDEAFDSDMLTGGDPSDWPG